MTSVGVEDKVNAKINSRVIRGRDLHEAARNNNVKELKRLLSLGAKVDFKNELKLTALQIAAYENRGNSHFEVIQVLLENGANVNKSTKYSGSPLYYLAKEADVEVVKLLLDYKADVNYSYGTSLFEAIKGGKVDVVQLLLDYGTCIQKVGSNGFTLLHQAACCNSGNSHFKVAELLLKKGADVNAQNVEKMTPLHYLVRRADVEIVQLFLDFKANVNCLNEFEEIPLFNALIGNSKEIVQLLLDYGSRVNTLNIRDGSTLLHTACINACSFEIIKSLVKKNMYVNALDKYGRTPLMVFDGVASESDALTYLLNYADLNIIDLSGKNILSWAHRKFIWKIILEHIAKMQALEISLHPGILDVITNNKEKQSSRQSYFEMCTNELSKAKNTKLRNCWVTFFNLLLDSKRKLKNYAGNQDLIEDFKNTDCLKKFPIYGNLMEKKIAKGVQMRKFFDNSTEILSDLIPIFNPTHLIIRDLLDSLKTKELLKLCKNY